MHSSTSHRIATKDKSRNFKEAPVFTKCLSTAGTWNSSKKNVRNEDQADFSTDASLHRSKKIEIINGNIHRNSQVDFF